MESLGALLFASIVLVAQDTKQQISESIYIFALTFSEEDASSSVLKVATENVSYFLEL